MAKLQFCEVLWVCILLMAARAVGANVEHDDEDVPETEHINPLGVLKEAQDKVRDERGIFDFFKKEQPAVTPVQPLPGSLNAGFSFKTVGTGYGGSGYGGSGYGNSGYSVSYGGTGGSGYGANTGLSLGLSPQSGVSLSYGLGQGGYGVKTHQHPSSAHYTAYGAPHGHNMYHHGQHSSSFHLQVPSKIIPQFGLCKAYILPEHVDFKCRDSQCEVFCTSTFTFPDGKTNLKLVCIGDSWIIRDSEHVVVPPCQAQCLPACKNNGICIEPGLCKCPETFTGPYCEHKRALCSQRPAIKNGYLKCNPSNCAAGCSAGFQFPDGSTYTNLECVDGQYVDKKTGLPNVPECKPICSPECSNGGRCITPGICECGRDYRGDRCQYSVNVCNVTRTNFNGNYKCSYQQTTASCILSCPAGIKAEGRLDINYMCDYSKGEFTPSPLPKCLYPAGAVIRQGSQSTQYSKTPGYAMGGSSSYSYQYMTSREKIMAILARYKEYDERSEWWSSEESVITPSSYSLYESGNINIVMDRSPKPAFCTTWGGTNVKTFDGLVYRAPLSCSHTLINDNKDSLFDVTLKGCPYGSGYGCAHALTVNWQSVPYTFENLNGTVRLHTPTKNFPFHAQIMGMKIIPVAQHLQIDLESVGLVLDWDQHQYVGVHASPALWARVGGLCGSLDGDYKNDLMTKTGKVVETVKSFIDSWRVDDRSELCTMDTSGEVEYDIKACDPNKRHKALEICERLIANEKLDDCMKTFNFEALIKTCVDDYCNCANQKHPETCNCDALSMLAKECEFKGIKLEHGWRNLEICPISCGFGRVYLPCGPDVEPTCELHKIKPTKGKCNEGCFCPEHTVQYKDACIPQEMCPCIKGGREFKPESTIKQKCNTCTCKNGDWVCSEKECGARCGAIGDPHYQTFDGKRFDFMGKCSYYLLKTPNVSVEAENVACSGAISENLNFAAPENPSCTKSVTIRFTQRNGIPTNIKLEQGLAALLNGKEMTKFPKILGGNEVLIRKASSTFMTVDFPGGIRVWWDGVSRVYIDAPPALRHQTSGLCGTFNSKTEDDFLTPEGDIETSVEAFADKWRTKDTCDFLAQTALSPHPCTANPDKKEEAEKHCAWLLDDIFTECQWIVDHEQYYEDCLYDVCACKEEPSKCFCPILSAYGAECMRQGVKTGWRMSVKDCAIKCPVGQVYDECGDSCTHSCEDLATKNTCARECVEGCRCPHGEYLNDQGECVPQSKCHCTFDGISFNPGYKEVRPGSKFLELCTCHQGIWECEEAAADDDKKYPPSSELRAKCAVRPYAEFTKCMAREPRTCKNMHEYKADLEECVPGCQCMEGYVYDTALDMCVLPEKCSCHHSGKSYNDGDKIKEDCNTCVCQAGNWKCSTNGCESTCSVWGDSHFSTFDHHDFDFQGACDYVLSKGMADNGDGYTITIQNVLCGTMGVTCSKSVEIAITGSIQDTIRLTGDASYLEDPDKAIINKLRDLVNTKSHGAFHVYKAGVFVVVEVLPLHLQVKWDEGTRVYVKLGNSWKGKVSGLCGNYNDNAMDDMKSPSQALETSSLDFGHSWRVQKFCKAPSQPIDACKEHPQRETWAQLKCGVLKSNQFKDCHAEVPVEKYLKRCIFDTCACDQGGDCECLCTAVAAYAHACSQKGIDIRWRTPHFCPMQCDPHCAEYKSCTPACPVETCDNFLDQSSADHMCKNEHCLEGCMIKACEPGMIYLNDTYKECVPKSECKPVCLIKEGRTFYEGDITYQDECATCRCSKKKEVCSGVKCTAEPTTPHSPLEVTTSQPLKTQEQPQCIRGWTRWFDDDTDASGKTVRLNDEEKLPRYDRMESIYGTCKKQFMKKIECRVVGSHESSDFMDENVFCNLNDGLSCVGQCHDYEIRVFCECGETEVTTVKPTVKPQTGETCDNVIAEYKEYPGDCHKFLQCSPKIEGGWHYVEKTCGESMMFNPVMSVCDHIAVVQEMKPDCGKSDKVDLVQICADGQVWSECANQCEHTCHYYGMILKKRGLCQSGEHCKPGCVDAKRGHCKEKGKYWRDEFTCVEADACPCMDKSEKYVQPHMPFVGEWEVCQCLDNAYTCVPTKIEEIPTTVKPSIVTVVDEQPKHTKEFEFVPVTVTPPKACNPSFIVPLIEGNLPLPDSVFNATSSMGPSYVPAMARLVPDAKEHLGAWSPMVNDQSQYLQITLPELEPIYGIVTAGNPEFNNYVTLFKIMHSHDGENYHELHDESGKPQLFTGPLDSRTPEKILFKIPIEAKALRVYPLRWVGSIAMRVELMGCDHYGTTTTLRPLITPSTEHVIIIKDELPCPDPMGVENGKMHPHQVKASSIWHLPKPAKKPRLIDLLKLSSPAGWKPVVNSPNEYVEFDFLEPRNISGFITKGGPDGWVTGYNVLFSKNRLIWNKVLDHEGQPKLFHGNYDKLTEKPNYFQKPILTQYMKIMPVKWEQNINMRIEPIGCFQSYPEIASSIVEVKEPPASKCLLCDGVTDSSATDGNCKCKDGLYWDGSKCVQSNLCPCVENYITYPIGSIFENKECEECVCVLGGHSSCKPKKCPPCDDKTKRPVVGAGCYCKCEPCPKHQRLCPSSGDCIPEVLWCNGIRDCADDEDDSCTHTITVTSKPIIKKEETEVISCPVPECPPNTKMKITQKKQRKMSSMFSSSFTKNVTIVREGGMIRKSKVTTSSEEYLDKPGDGVAVDYMQEDDCEEFTCIPIKRQEGNRTEIKICVEPKCPPNYQVDLDVSSTKPGDCPSYMCTLKPSKDNVCEISGKIFTTFDGTEFKYETCSHILARDLINSSWIISVHLDCTDETRKVCRKMITIKDTERQSSLTIKPKMRLDFNGFDYSVQQLINSPICKASFVISQVGDTVLVVSPSRGFWVLYDDIGYIKIGISSKFIRTVDGLCGYYDGIAGNDKRAPDGTVIPNTAKFGDSWFDNKTPKDKCYPQTCPSSLQVKALALCNSVRHPTFAKCGKSVNHKQFVSKCVETTCECLKANNDNINACKCNILQDFVKKCLTVNPNVQLNTWRTVHQCEISCPAPLVHSDCYKRRCEPSCDSLNSDDCPIIPDACFAGCYCPEGTVRKGDTCVPISECKDCVCNTIGSTQYFTYDRNNFAFNGNCTYLLTRDLVLPGVHTFQVYVSMDDCHKLGKLSAPAHSSCTKSLHIINGDHVIHIQRVPLQPKTLQLFVDGFEIKKLPYKDSWIHLSEVPGKEVVLGLTDAHVEVKAAFDDLLFSIGVPSVKYGGKMEGLCGNCDGNPDNDLKVNRGNKKVRKSSTDLGDIIKSWTANEPKLGLDPNECVSEIEIENDCLPLPPEKDPCMQMFDNPVFSKCNMIVDPMLYIMTCQKDMCKPGNEQKGACETLTAYAQECAKQGICLNWRTADLCPYECGPGMMYEPCGCSKTCESLQSLDDFQAVNMNTNTFVDTVSSEELCQPSERYEGCFCPPGKVMDKGKCIAEELCVKCEDPERSPGERWQRDKCTECLCDKSGKTQCMEHKCAVQDKICDEGDMPKKIVDDSQCCPRYICVPQPKLPPAKLCLEPLLPQCGPGQFNKQKTGPDGCPMYICECKPKEECEVLAPLRALKAGEKLVKEELGCCPTQKIICDKSQCPAKPSSCDEEFYEVFAKQEPNDCCPTYYCAPPKDECVVEDEPGKKKYLKPLGASWLHPKDPCKRMQCTYGPHDTTQLVSSLEICDTTCGQGFEYVRRDLSKCCGECQQTHCVLDGLLYEPKKQWKSSDNCTTFSCEPKGEALIVSSVTEQCPDVSNCAEHLLEQKQGSCCKMCKQEPVKEDQTNCLPVSLADTETLKMVRVHNPGHGDCVNEKPIQGYTECMGACNSGSKYNKATLGQDKICHCCSIKGYKSLQVELTCDDGSKMKKDLEIPASCGCQPCSDSAGYQTENQFDVRLEPLPLASIIMQKRQ